MIEFFSIKTGSHNWLHVLLLDEEIQSLQTNSWQGSVNERIEPHLISTSYPQVWKCHTEYHKYTQLLSAKKSYLK